MLVLYTLILLGVLSLVFSQYERVAICRIITVSKIEKLCRERNINFKVMNHTYPFSKNKRNEFDFIIRVDKTIIPVKFFSSIEKKSTVILDQSGKICIAERYTKPLSRDGRKQFVIRKSYGSLPNMRISKKIVGQRYRCFPVILNEPAFQNVMFKDNLGNVSDFYEGTHTVVGCTFVDRRVFADLIEIYKNRG